jgi:hypothetical protein
VATITVAPHGALDLHDSENLRRYAATVVPAVLASALAGPPAAPARPAATGKRGATRI